MILTGKARLAGVMGWPISHSRSPRLHGYWLDHYGIDGAYLPLPVRPDDLAYALRALPKLGYAGTNLTIPHKVAALAICDTVDDTARRIGAVNTVVVQSDGTLAGTNTDAFGFLENLRDGSRWRPSDGPAVVLGAGGAARAVVTALLDAGTAEIRVVNRTRSRADTLAASLGEPVTVHEWTDLPTALTGSALLANTTSLGMAGQPPLEIDIGALPTEAVVNDIVYVPLETDLLRSARQRGNPTVDGLGMLLHQARPGFAAWFGKNPEVTPALRDFVLSDRVS